MIDWDRFARQPLHTEPYLWAVADRLYAPGDAGALAATFPGDHFKHLADYAGEKDFEYESRELIGMGATSVSRPAALSGAWRALAEDLLSERYRDAMATLIGIDLSDAPLEVNVFHYPPGGSLGPHPDLSDKIVTHVLYFNESWNDAEGGCLTILGSADANDVVHTISPIVGNSAILVRSDNSWHAVSPVARDCRSSRRSLTATFYRPGSISTMWPPSDHPQLHNYPPSRWERWWKKLRG
ncbi:MAG: 2OG-Fe(II) oxygenase [Acidobacteria bacterium]|nr:2OG-Fe(II) oxygenase [Acidobacteriota bacterium]